MLQTEELIIPEVSRHGLDGDTDSGLHFLINDLGSGSGTQAYSMIGDTTEYEYEDRKNVK